MRVALSRFASVRRVKAKAEATPMAKAKDGAGARAALADTKVGAVERLRLEPIVLARTVVSEQCRDSRKGGGIVGARGGMQTVSRLTSVASLSPSSTDLHLEL